VLVCAGVVVVVVFAVRPPTCVCFRSSNEGPQGWLTRWSSTGDINSKDLWNPIHTEHSSAYSGVQATMSQWLAWGIPRTLAVSERRRLVGDGFPRGLCKSAPGLPIQTHRQED
jgi:hypothetical protein